MQDYPKLLQGTPAVVGFTQFERWLAFSPGNHPLPFAHYVVWLISLFACVLLQ